MRKQYTIGEDSRQFLDALDAFAAFQCRFLNALTHAYGDKQGNDMFQEHREMFDGVERAVMDYLRIQFTQCMGIEAEAVTI